VTGAETSRRSRDSRSWLVATIVIFGLTVAQLVVATFVSGLDQFEGKGFGARLVAYPILMVAVPAVWLALRRFRGHSSDVPWLAFALVMAPFLVDVTGNTLDLYDSLVWWEMGEWYTFIRHGTELDTAYEDTLGDEALGTAGGLVAALVVTARRT
jgi:hypothetical protein